MGKNDDPTATTTTAQTSKTEPWKAAQPLLKQLLASYSGLSTDVTPEQQAALDTLMGQVGGLPQFGPQAAEALGRGFNFSTAPQQGMLAEAYGNLQDTLNPITSASLDPYSTPGFSDAIAKMTGDITDKVKGAYSAAGRDPSGAGSFAGSLGRGLTEGIAPVISDQYNKNVANRQTAANTLFGAGGTTASGQAGLMGNELTAWMNALNSTGQVQNAFLQPGQAGLNIANMQNALPWSNLAQLLGPATQIAGLGGQSSGTGTQQQFQPQSTASNIIGGATAAASLLPMIFSDERVKEDVEGIGMLNDGQKVYRYRYTGEPTFRIGLLAQEVENFAPESVGEVGGILAVEHKGATDRAAELERMAA